MPLLRRAYEGWHELAQESGRDLLRLCGGIYIGDPESPVFTGSLASAHVHGGRFVEEVAFGDGAWERLPSRVQKTIIANTATFIEENTDPGIYGIDLHPLSQVAIPVLITQGTQSPPFFATVLDQVQAVLPQVERRALQGVGHVPQLTDPDLYAAQLQAFITAASRDC